MKTLKITVINNDKQTLWVVGRCIKNMMAHIVNSAAVINMKVRYDDHELSDFLFCQHFLQINQIIRSIALSSINQCSPSINVKLTVAHY